MHKQARIFVAGHRGLVGSTLLRQLRAAGFAHPIVRGREKLDLTQAGAVRDFFERERPEYVFLAAAKVGGIEANRSCPADFIRINLEIQTNVIDQSYRYGVKRLLFLGSTCIYPRDCPQPIKEEYLLTGPLEPTNSAYAIAKIAGLEMCRSYNQQYGTQFLCAMPTNLYGPGDDYDLETSHVLPALLRKFHEAKQAAVPQVVVWGSGRPLREFMHVDDLAAACIFLLGLPEETFHGVLQCWRYPLINVGSGEDISIAALAQAVAEVVGYRGAIVYDASKPDGTPRKLADSSRLRALGWRPAIPLAAGLERTYAEWLVAPPTC